MVLNVISVKPLDYHMANIWDAAMSNDDLNHKFKGMIGDYLQNNEIVELTNYLLELKCHFYYHEFVKRAVLMGIEKDQEALESVIKLITQLFNSYGFTSEQVC